MTQIEFIQQSGKIPAHFRVPNDLLDKFRGLSGHQFPNTVFKQNAAYNGNREFMMVEPLNDVSPEKCNAFVTELNSKGGKIC